MDINLEHRTILITGTAGFIGANLAMYVLKRFQNITVVGIDNFNNYYSTKLKELRVAPLLNDHRFVMVRGSIADKALLNEVFSQYRPSIVVNLAAQAGVRYSITNPDAYIESNIVGFYNIIEQCRHSYDNGDAGVEHLVYASSSSVYGGNKKIPFSTDDNVDSPVSLYAATKKSDELIAHAYAKLYNIPCTGLRFFTVYGPAGRPDMAYYSFAEKMRKGEKIKIYNYGKCQRDFTYIDDIVEGVVRVMQKSPNRQQGEDGLPIAPYRIYNIGGGNPENLMYFVTTLHKQLIAAGALPQNHSLDSLLELVPMQPGDVPTTFADTKSLQDDFGFTPSIPLEEGLMNFAQWYAKHLE